MTKTRIVKTGYSAEDKETTMSYDYLAKEWVVYSRVPSDITRMMKLYGDDVEVLERLNTEDGAPVLVRARLPKEAIGFKKLLSEDTRKRMADNARKNFGV